MKSNRTVMLAISILVAASLTGCANIKTIDRTTPIEDETAIHLDAQQRLVLFTKTKKKDDGESTENQDGDGSYQSYKYCAEPNPDAMSSYLASIDFGFSTPTQNEASVKNLLQSSTYDIGLRTQSITLMRDVFYRICEASNNGYLDKKKVPAFIRRNQDLTAVVLAIEQLTGAVTPNQVILPPGIRASANLLLSQQFLTQAKYNVQKWEKGVTTAEKEMEKVTSAQLGEEAIKKAKDNLKNAEDHLKDAREVRNAIQASRDATLTNTTAEPRNSEQSSMPVQHNQLNAEAAKEIAIAVNDMVTKVIEKSDTMEVCMSYLTRDSEDKGKVEVQGEDKGEVKGEVEDKDNKILKICEDIVAKGSGAFYKVQREAKDAREEADEVRKEEGELSKQLQGVREEAGKTKVKAEELSKQLQDAREEADKVRKEEGELSKQLQDVREKTGKAQGEAEGLRKQLQDVREEAEKTRGEAKELSKQLQDAREKTGKAQGEAKGLRKQLQDVREEAGKTRGEAKELSKQLQDAREKTGKAQGEAEELRKQLQDAREKADKARREAEELRKQLQTGKVRDQTEPSKPENGKTKKTETPNSG